MGALLSGKLCTHAVVSSIIFPDNALRAESEKGGGAKKMIIVIQLVYLVSKLL